MLTVTDLDLYYDESHILWNIHLECRPGRRHALLGRNGAGKTSLVRSLLGLVQPRRGRIQVNGEDISRSKPWERVEKGLALVPQGRDMFARLTVEENLRLSLRDDEVVIPPYIFEAFPALHPLLSRRSGSLSGGQQQQVAIARALLLNPKILILDEPTEGIQPNIVEQIGEVLVEASRRSNLTVLTIEQKLSFVRDYHDHYFIMDKGRIVDSGDVTDLDDGRIKQHLLL